MAALLTSTQFKSRTIMPGQDVDTLEARRPGFLDTILLMRTAEIQAQLAKRYEPFTTTSTPEIVLCWLVALVTLDAYLARGFSQSSDQDALISGMAQQARDQIKQAADAKDGLFELPLRQDTPEGSGIARGEPLGYTEATPYDWMDAQRSRVRYGGLG